MKILKKGKIPHLSENKNKLEIKYYVLSDFDEKDGIELDVRLGSYPVLTPGMKIKRGSISEGNDAIYLDSSVVSATHAILHFEKGAFYLSDLGSTNGTFFFDGGIKRQVKVGDKKRLKHRDKVRFADQTLEFTISRLEV